MSSRRAIGKLIGQRLAEARNGLDLSLKEVAKAMGYPSYQTMLSIEQGKRNLQAWELAKLAKIYQRPFDHFIALDDESQSVQPAILWRSKPDPKTVRTAEQVFLTFCENYRLLEDLTGRERPRYMPMPVDRKSFDKDPFSKVKDIARERQRSLNLGARPASTLANILTEDQGIRILYYQFKTKGSSAAAYQPDGFGAVIIVNDNEAPWRKVYDIAHEYFHLLTWDVFTKEEIESPHGAKSNVERYADSFASVLLLPQESVEKEFKKRVNRRRITGENIVDLSRIFGVSLEAMVWGLCIYSFISKATAEDMLKNEELRMLDKEHRIKGWNSDISQDYVRLGYQAMHAGRISKGKFAEMMCINIADVDLFLSNQGLYLNGGSKHEYSTT